MTTTSSAHCSHSSQSNTDPASPASPSDHRRSLRALNLSFVEGQTPPAERPSHAQLRQLDSSLKRCTGFIRKLKTTPISEKSIDILIAEANLLNLSRYISEIAGALADIKLKSADVSHLVLFCGHMHRRYHDFTSTFIDALTITILNHAAKSLVVRKAAVKLLVEMFTLGLYFDVAPVLNVLRSLIRAPKESKDAYDQRCNNLIVLSSFAKNAAKVLLPPAEQLLPEHPDAWQSRILPNISKNSILSGLQTYFDSDVQRLFSEATENVRRTRAALSRSALRVVTDDPAVAEHDAAKQTYEKLLAASNALADAIGKPLLNESQPDGADAKSPLDPSYESTDPSLSASLYNAAKHKPGMESVAIAELDCPFEEEEQRLFYTELVTLKPPLSKSKSPSKDQASSNKHGNDRTSEKSTPSPPETNRRRGGERAVVMDRLLNRLSSIQTRQDADRFALDFAMGMETAKNAPKRLSKILYPVSSQKLNLLPAYARVAANLKPVCQDMVAGMVSSLEDDFKFFVGKSDVDEKELALCVKTAQYVGEYVKFSLIDVVTACDLLTMCLKDFSGHRVDAGCHLLETCGRYLFLTLASHPRMINMLDTIWRLKSVRNLEARHNALIETAYFSVRVSSSSTQYRKKTRPPLHEYVRHLLYNNLNVTNIRWTLSQLLKLPWDAQLERYVIRKFVNVYQAKYSTIVHIASLIAYMTKSLRDVSIGVVDMLLEAIRAGMERNDGRESQRRIAEIRLLGELYNCNVIEEKLVYNVLYQLITLGHETNHEQNRHRRGGVSEEDSNGLRVTLSNGLTSGYGYSSSNAPDPAGDFFRIRLVCLLLETCGTRLYTANGRKVEVFWIFLERYVYCKARQSGYGDQLPLHIEQLLGEVFQRVLSEKPAGRLEENVVSRSRRQGRGVRRSRTLQQAVDAVTALERNGSDCMLIAVPDRQIVRSASTRRGAKGGGVRGNVVDGFQTVGGSWDEEEEDGDETDHDEGRSDEDDDDDEDDDEHEYYYRERERDRDGRDRKGARNEEEEAFARELASVTASAVQSAKATVRVTKLDRMTIPMSLMVQKLEEDRAAAAMKAARSVGGEGEGEGEWAGDVQFKLLVRKGGKSQLQGIAVPATSSLAVAARESESANAQRHEETKRLILGSSTLLSDDDGEDDMQVSAIQHARQKQENIRMQRDADERELLCSVFRKKGR